ncbi:MAG: hypothetical protein LBD02_06235 [Christensenellaceae bacterium]|nr:hypothetical protein [Christensenellaceae bacterium]
MGITIRYESGREKWLYDWFVRLGGELGNEHPLYCVLSGSDYLDGWFGRRKARKIPLSDIDAGRISFTFGDSVAWMSKSGRRDPFALETLPRRSALGRALAPFWRKCSAIGTM